MDNSKELCGRRFTRRDFNDTTGCILPDGHTQSGEGHICMDIKGDYIEWGYDFDCGCDDCRSDDIEDMCIIYSKTDKP